jgi:DNA-3-methyladenine glycosylase
MKRLDREFFNRPTVKVAQELLGKFLVRKINNKIIKARIIETEAYCGTRDLACHASKGLTERTRVMFGPAGFSYVYMIYGMYHCLNIVTEKEGNPSAVLIRAVDCKNCDGPGKLCRKLRIDRKLNMVDLTKSNLLWIENGKIKVKKSQIKRGKRIGVDYAGKWKDKLWRFYLWCY